MRLTLRVKRENGSGVEPTETGTESSESKGDVVFFDEKLRIECSCADSSALLHLCVVIAGTQSRGEPHSVLIFDSTKQGASWEEVVHVRHPRSPLTNPFLEVSVTSSGVAHSQQQSRAEIPAFGGFELLKQQTRQAEFDSEEARREATARWRAPLRQAIDLEMRSMRPALSRTRVLAELNILALVPVLVRKCEVKMPDGVCELLGRSPPPVEVIGGGVWAQCYSVHLKQPNPSLQQPVSARALEIALECELLECGAPVKIKTQWTPMIDFEGLDGPTTRTPAMHLPAHSPGYPFLHPSASSVSLDLNEQEPNPDNTTDVYRRGSASTLDVSQQIRRTSTNLSLMSGLSIFLSGPQFVKLGSVFKWHITAISRSQRERAFSLTFGEGGTAASAAASAAAAAAASATSNTSNPSNPSNAPNGGGIPSAYAKYDGDSLRLRAQAHYHAAEAGTGVLPLCHGFTVSKLAPLGCFETVVELKALRAGTHTIETARIRDLATGDTYDVGALLSVIVHT